MKSLLTNEGKRKTKQKEKKERNAAHLNDGRGNCQVFVTIVIRDGLLSNDDGTSEGLRDCRREGSIRDAEHPESAKPWGNLGH